MTAYIHSVAVMLNGLRYTSDSVCGLTNDRTNSSSALQFHRCCQTGRAGTNY